MNAKKSLSAGIIAIIFSVGGLIFNGIYGLFYLIINDISEAVENKGTFALTTIILVLMAILMLLYISNIVFAGISFKYTRRNGEKYSEGQKFLKVFTLILGITAVLNFVLAILQYNSILLLVLCLILTIAFVVSMMSLINDLKKNKLSQKI